MCFFQTFFQFIREPGPCLGVAMGQHNGSGLGLYSVVGQFVSVGMSAEVKFFNRSTSGCQVIEGFKKESTLIFSSQQLAPGCVRVAVTDEAETVFLEGQEGGCCLV